MAALTLTLDSYRDKVLGGWQGKSAGITLGQPQRGRLTPGRDNFYSPVPGQPAASVAIDFPLVWLATLEQAGPEIAPEDMAIAWLEHLDYPQDEFGYAALNLLRGLPPPASGAYANWFRSATGGVMRADLWAMVAPGAPQVATAYAYHDAKLDHCEDGIWAAMFLAALGSAAFFLTDPLMLLTIGLAMIPRTCRTARAVKTALAAGQRGAAWLEARESIQHEVGGKNFTDVPQNIGFFTLGLLYGLNDFGRSLCAAVNCGYDSEVVGGMLGAVLGIQRGSSGLPQDWMRPIGDLIIPGMELRDFDAPPSLTEVAERVVAIGRRIVEARCSDVALVEQAAALVPSVLEPATSAPASETPSEPQPLAPTGAEAASTDQAPPIAPEPAPDALDAAATSEPAADTPSLPTAPEPSVPTSEGPIAQAADTPATAEPVSSSEPAGLVGLPVQPAPSPDAPAAEADTSGSAPRLGAFAPQPVSAVEPPSFAPATTPPYAGPGAAPPTPAVAPDLTGAIAWADSTQVKPLLIIPPNSMTSLPGPFEVLLDTGDSPTIGYGTARTLSFSALNRGTEAFSGRIALLAPPGWQITAPPNLGQRQYVAAHTGNFRADFTLRVVEGQGRIEIANAITLRFTPDNGAASFDAEFVLLGASCWWTVGPFANFDGEGFDRTYLPEERPGLNESYLNRLQQNIRWEKRTFAECLLDLDPLFKGSAGVCYGQTILRSPTAREARLVANTNSGVKVWLNGALVLRRFNREVFRPQIGSGPWAVDVSLKEGDNSVLVKWVRSSEPYEFSLTVSDRYGRGLPEIGNTNW